MKSDKMKVYELDTVLEFGKHCGYTVQRIFTGSNFLTFQDKKRLLEHYSNLFVKYKNEIREGKLKSISLSNTRGSSKKQFLFGIETYLEWDPVDPMINKEIHYEDSIDFLIQRYRSNVSYLSWCIEEIDTFCINPKHINQLMLLDCFKSDKIDIKLINNKYDIDISLHASSYKESFNYTIIKINEEKFDRIS